MTNIRKTLAIPTHRIDMKPITLLAASFCLLTLTAAHAIDAKYREKLERSGCTQVSEMQGCDINKTRAENAKAGFTNDAAPAAASKAAPAVKPSFDCAKAKPGSIEALICADPALAALDSQLADVYAAARKKAANEKPPVLQAEQRGWVKGRDECWKSRNGDPTWITASWTVSTVRDCVEASYRVRTSELQAVWGLVPVKGPTAFACQLNPANEVVATFFETDPPTARLERGDRTITAWLVQTASGAKYEGQNVDFWSNGKEATATWLGESLKCEAK